MNDFKMPRPPGGGVWRVTQECYDDSYGNFSDYMKIELGEYRTRKVGKHWWSKEKTEEIKTWYPLIPHRLAYLNEGKGTVEEKVVSAAYQIIGDYQQEQEEAEHRRRASEIAGEYM